MPPQPELQHGKEAPYNDLNSRNTAVVEQAILLTQEAEEVKIVRHWSKEEYEFMDGWQTKHYSQFAGYWKKLS